MAFGLCASPMYMWLKFSRKIILSCQQNHPLAAVTTLSRTEITEYMAAVAKKFPVLEQHKLWGAADGLKLPLERSNKWSVQNRFYNGWTHGMYVSRQFPVLRDRVRAVS